MDDACSVIFRTVSTPATWPATRGRPRARAHRPFPSMIIATCIPEGEALCIMKPESQKKCVRRDKGRGSFFAGGANKRFHMIEIALQSPTTGCRQTILGMRQPAAEGLFTTDVAGFLELAGVDAQVAVGCAHELFQFIEAQHLIHGQRTHDPEAQTLVNDAVERRRRPRRGTRAHTTLAAWRRRIAQVLWHRRAIPLSHRASTRPKSRTSGADRRSPTRATSRSTPWAWAACRRRSGQSRVP